MNKYDRKRLWVDPDLWLYRGLHWLLFGMSSLTLYVLAALVVSWPYRPIHSLAEVPWWSSLVALGLIVVTSIPLYGWLARAVHHLVYGQHDDAYAIVERVNRHLSMSPSPDALLPMLAETLADTLRLPYVVIKAHQSETQITTTFGTAPPNTELITIPLLSHKTVLGSLHVSARRSDEWLSAADLSLLTDLARQVSITLHAAQLTNALQRSRQQLVVAREEERRRIRRNLHDGLGPTLASIRLQLHALRQILRQDPNAAEQLIDELRSDVSNTTAEIRRLVYDLRPPMLDEFGLVGALRNLELSPEKLTRYVNAPDLLPPLPAALEVALYRIAAEALHNIARHAHATECTICLTTDRAMITLAVQDNGCGLPATYLAGVGHQSMIERAAELGGNVTFTCAPAGGLCVLATIPLPKPNSGAVEIHD